MRMGVVLSLVVFAVACGDNLLGVRDASVTCEGAADGTFCGDAMICLGGACSASRCGDGFVDPSVAEECDDGNAASGDGCDPNCLFTCDRDEDCEDSEPCNGAEACNISTHTCANGIAQADGAPCSTASHPTGVCRAETCVAPGCGNGVVDGSEQCDDMNVTPGDGCEVNCMFTCTNDGMCADSTVCNGVETCVLATHTCSPGTSPTCNDNNDCTDDSCDAATGCLYVLFDQDGDGFAPTSRGGCGTDCNDGNPNVNPSKAELPGDPNDVDENCDMAISCYVDGDNDGYRTTATVASADADCDDLGEARAAEPAGDCNDGNANVSPGAQEIADNGVDDNCSGFHGCYFDADNDNYSRSDAAIRDDSLDADCVDSGEGSSSDPRTDCNDTAASVSPGVTELADNGVDDNCSGFHGCYFDADNDSYSRSDGAVRDDSLDVDCSDSGEGSTGEPRTDCNDTVGIGASIHPGATEICFNGFDDDCDNPTAQDEAAECSINCDWSGSPRWLSHGWDGDVVDPSRPFKNGIWVSCINNRVSNMTWVASLLVGVTPAPSGTADPIAGCNWGTGTNRWMSQGWDGGGFEAVYGAYATCDGTRVTGLSWGLNSTAPPAIAPPTVVAGQLGCNWSGAVWIGNGWNGSCNWLTGMEITCNNSHITNMRFVENSSCPRLNP